MGLILGLVASDPSDRLAGAVEADVHERGAGEFQRQLVRGGLASEYGNEIRVWLEELE
jgi:serine/threonine-protein kinase